MGMQASCLGGVVLVAAAVFTPAIAMAQATMPEETTILIEIESIPEAMNQAYFGEGGTFFEATSIFTQTNSIIGAGVPASFPDLQIARDSQRVHELYVELMHLQTSSDPIVRVPDLTNPFNSSVQLLPTGSAGTRLVGTELLFERVPARY